MRIAHWMIVAVLFEAGGMGAATPKRLSTLTSLPLAFEADPGGSAYAARGPGYRISLSPAGAALSFGRTSLGIHLAGANPSPELEGDERLPGRSNHFTGRDPAAWRLNRPQYAKVRYREVYRGVDLVFYGQSQRLEYDFIVAPGADPGEIRLRFQGTDSFRLDGGGDLLATTAAGEIRQHRPVIYQEVGGRRRTVHGRYILLGRQEIGFRIAAYDRTRPLVIDPVLSFATFFGGANMDIATDAAVDAAGNIYIAGGTASRDLATTAGALQMVYGGGIDVMPSEGIGIGDGYVAKLRPDGSSVAYATFLGGDDGDFATAIAVDAAGNAYITGFTRSGNFPVTPGALQPVYKGGRNWSDDFPLHFGDAFIVKLDPDGSLVYSSFLGGSGSDAGMGIALDGEGNAFVVGTTNSTDFPVSEDAVQRTHAGGAMVAPDMPMDFGDAFVAKIDAGGAAIRYATYLGGSKSDLLTGIAVDASGMAYVAGTTWSKDFPVTPSSYRAAGGDADVIVAKLNETGTALLYSSSFGGSGADECYGVAIDAMGNAYAAGRTRGAGFPATANAYQSRPGGNDDAFVAKLNTAGTELIYATFLGGKGAETCFRPAADAAGNAYLAGDSRSPDFPTTPDAMLRRLTGQHNAFVAKFDPSGSALVYSTLVAGSDDGKAMRVLLDSTGNAYAVGFTSSPDFPATAGSAQTRPSGMYDAFVLKLADLAAPAAAAAASTGSQPRERVPRGVKFLRWLKSQVLAR